MDPFEAARAEFTAALTTEEKALLQGGSTAQDVLAEVQIIERSHRDKSVSRKFMKKIELLVKGVERYGEALNVLANVKPEILGFLWGGVRIVLLVSS